MNRPATGRYQLAKCYMENHARPLERELFLVRFAGTPIEGALSAVRVYGRLTDQYRSGPTADCRIA